MKAFKAFIKTFEAPQRRVKIKIYVKLLSSFGIGREKVNGWKPVTFFVKSFIIDFRLGSEYTSAIRIIRYETKFE